MIRFNCIIIVLIMLLALVGSGAFDPISLALLLIAFALLLCTCFIEWPERLNVLANRFSPRAFAVLLGSELAIAAVIPPAIDLPENTSLWFFRLVVLAIIGVALSYGRGPTRGLHWRFPLLLALFFLLGGWVIRHSPDPYIDVLPFQQQASRVLLEGKNPYAAKYPNRLSQPSFFYGENVLADNEVQSFPYPPLSLLMALPGYLVGDVRWSLLLVLIATAGLLRAAGMSLGVPRELAELTSLVFLLHPRGLVVLQFAWTEIFLMLTVSFFVWAVASKRRLLSIVGLALVISAKQYGILLLPCLFASIRLRVRDVVVACILAGLIALPFFAWDPQAFWKGVVAFQFQQPFRRDSLSVLAAIAAATGVELPAAIGFIVATCVAALCFWRAKPGIGNAALTGSAFFLGFFLFNKQAFLNYYWFCSSMLVLALACANAKVSAYRPDLAEFTEDALGFDERMPVPVRS